MPLLAMILNYNNQKNLKANIFDIQGLSVDDGPRCRTLFFFSGCTLDCFWCSNPEGIKKNPEVLYLENKCISCGKFSFNAISFYKNTKILIDRDFCSEYYTNNCLTECYTGTLRLSSYEISIEKLYNIISRDGQNWGNNGGITHNGGEALIQIDFVEIFLEICYNAYIHTYSY